MRTAVLKPVGEFVLETQIGRLPGLSGDLRNRPINAWVCRSKKELVFQNSLLFYDDWDPLFDPTRAVRWTDSHKSVTEEGTRISEWRVLLRGLETKVKLSGATVSPRA